jgi:hypothetical protein
MPDALAERVRDVAGKDNVSAWLTRVARNELLRQECRALADWDRIHRDPQDEIDDEAERELVRAREEGK